MIAEHRSRANSSALAAWRGQIVFGAKAHPLVTPVVNTGPSERYRRSLPRARSLTPHS